MTNQTKNYGLVKSIEELSKFFERMLEQAKPIGFDIEAGYTGKDKAGVALLPFHPEWVMAGFSFTNSTQWARYASIGHDNGPNLDSVAAARLLWNLLNSGKAVIHNASYELQTVGRWFREVLWDDTFYGQQVRDNQGYFPVYSDTMIEAVMVQQYQFVGLKKLTNEVFGHDQMEISELFQDLPKTKMRYLRFNTRELTDEVVAYACEDAAWCLALHELHYPQVEKNMMFQTEMRLQPILAEMEREGLLLDWAEYERRQEDTATFKEAMNEEIQAELSERLGEVVNINLGSPKQVAELLYERLNLPVKDKDRTATGAPSTGEAALRALAKKDVAINQILQWREVGKLLSSYITKYLSPDIRYALDGRAHPNHKQYGAATGRMSVDGVSYQQWPKPYHYELNSGRTYDLNYRDFLIAPPEHRIIGFDYANVELRVLAGLSGDQNMIDAFNSGADFHKATAAQMFKVPIEEVTGKMRGAGKTISFATVYQSGAQNIADLLGVPKEEAEQFMQQYFEAYPKLREWMNARIHEGHRDGYVTTHFGRKYKVWEFLSSENWIQAKGERMCVNAPVQGTAADLMKLAMVRANLAIKKAGLQDKIRLIMSIHDALEFYVHDSIPTQQVIDLLYPAVSFKVPRFPDIEIRSDWHEGLKWGTVVEIALDKDKQITGYELGGELPNKEKYEFKAKDYRTVLNEYEAWLQLQEAAAQEESGEDDTPMALVCSQPRLGVEVVPLDLEPPWAHAKESPPKTIVVTLTEMPTKENWDRFKSYIAERTGKDTLRLVTPQGETDLKQTYELHPRDQGDISRLLGGADVRFVHPVDA